MASGTKSAEGGYASHKPSDVRDDYVFGRGYKASARVNTVHLWARLQTRWLLHPNVPAQKEDLKIADIGTGTAMWLVDLAGELPTTVTLEGFDISQDQFPPKHDLPANVTLGTMDIFKDIPEHLVGRYDIVHVRLFVTIVRNNDPSPLIRQLRQLLKPGGYLQWEETNNQDSDVLSTGPPDSTPAMHALKDSFGLHQRKLGETSWVNDLADTLQSHNFQSTTQHDIPLRRGLQRIWTDIVFLTLEDFSYSMLDQNPETAGTGKGQEVRDLVQKAYLESRTGAGYSVIFHVAVGQKPLEA